MSIYCRVKSSYFRVFYHIFCICAEQLFIFVFLKICELFGIYANILEFCTILPCICYPVPRSKIPAAFPQLRFRVHAVSCRCTLTTA